MLVIRENIFVPFQAMYHSRKKGDINGCGTFFGFHDGDGAGISFHWKSYDIDFCDGAGDGYRIEKKCLENMCAETEIDIRAVRL